MIIQRLVLFLALLTMVPAAGAGTITLYQDGSRVEQAVTAAKGAVTVALPADLLPGTLSISPATGTTLLAVELSPSLPPARLDKELAGLQEGRQRLQDRLQALTTREEIFTAAAKSQGSKAPRKTKANPEPLQTIRQGTDFAIAQLEAVYTARRRAEQELRRIDLRIAATRKAARVGGSNARITLSPANGRAMVRYATAEKGWQPYYHLYLNSGENARLQISARLSASYPGSSLRISAASIADSTAASYPLSQSSLASLAAYTLPLADQHYSAGAEIRFSGLITNNTATYLPPGAASLYHNGSYVGNFRFAGLSSGRSRRIATGL